MESMTFMDPNDDMASLAARLVKWVEDESLPRSYIDRSRANTESLIEETRNLLRTLQTGIAVKPEVKEWRPMKCLLWACWDGFDQLLANDIGNTLLPMLKESTNIPVVVNDVAHFLLDKHWINDPAGLRLRNPGAPIPQSISTISRIDPELENKKYSSLANPAKAQTSSCKPKPNRTPAHLRRNGHTGGYTRKLETAPSASSFAFGAASPSFSFDPQIAQGGFGNSRNTFNPPVLPPTTAGTADLQSGSQTSSQSAPALPQQLTSATTGQSSSSTNNESKTPKSQKSTEELIQTFQNWVGDAIRTAPIDRSFENLNRMAKNAHGLTVKRETGGKIGPEYYEELKKFLWALWDGFDPELEKRNNTHRELSMILIRLKAAKYKFQEPIADFARTLLKRHYTQLPDGKAQIRPRSSFHPNNTVSSISAIPQTSSGSSKIGSLLDSIAGKGPSASSSNNASYQPSTSSVQDSSMADISTSFGRYRGQAQTNSHSSNSVTSTNGLAAAQINSLSSTTDRKVAEQQSSAVPPAASIALPSAQKTQPSFNTANLPTQPQPESAGLSAQQAESSQQPLLPPTAAAVPTDVEVDMNEAIAAPTPATTVPPQTVPSNGGVIPSAVAQPAVSHQPVAQQQFPPVSNPSLPQVWAPQAQAAAFVVSNAQASGDIQMSGDGMKAERKLSKFPNRRALRRLAVLAREVKSRRVTKARKLRRKERRATTISLLERGSRCPIIRARNQREHKSNVFQAEIDQVTEWLSRLSLDSAAGAESMTEPSAYSSMEENTQAVAPTTAVVDYIPEALQVSGQVLLPVAMAYEAQDNSSIDQTELHALPHGIAQPAMEPIVEQKDACQRPHSTSAFGIATIQRFYSEQRRRERERLVLAQSPKRTTWYGDSPCLRKTTPKDCEQESYFMDGPQIETVTISEEEAAAAAARRSEYERLANIGELYFEDLLRPNDKYRNMREIRTAQILGELPANIRHKPVKREIPPLVCIAGIVSGAFLGSWAVKSLLTK